MPSREERVAKWVEESALKILTTPYYASETVSDEIYIDKRSPTKYTSFSEWKSSTVDMILNMRDNPNWDKETEYIYIFEAVERAFPVLMTLNWQIGIRVSILGPLVESLTKALG